MAKVHSFSLFCTFFFSSRRRHTRFSRDWSSDVCSSDLSAELAHELKNPLAIIKASVDVLRNQLDPKREHPAFGYLSDEVMRLSQIGRASCRERVEISVFDQALTRIKRECAR